MLMLKIQPKYIELLWLDPHGQKLSALGLVLMVVGALFIRKIVNIKI